MSKVGMGADGVDKLSRHPYNEPLPDQIDTWNHLQIINLQSIITRGGR